MILQTKQQCLRKFVSIIFYKDNEKYFVFGIEDVCDKNVRGDYSDIRDQVFKILGAVQRKH